MSEFQALEVSIEAIRQLQPVVARIRTRSSRLARQIEDAASSVALNIGEGSRRRGQDQCHLYRVAAGSAEEVRTGLRVAAAWGYVSPAATASCLECIDRLQKILWALTGGRARPRRPA